MLVPLTPYIHMSAHHSLNGGQSSRGMQSPSCTTVSGGQLQPGRQTAGQGTNGSSHVPSHPLHSEYFWPLMGHAACVARRDVEKIIWQTKYRQLVDLPNNMWLQWVTVLSLHSVILCTSLTRTLIKRDASAFMHHGVIVTAAARYTDSTTRWIWIHTCSIASFALLVGLAFNWTFCMVQII